MLNSAELEILNDPKYENIQHFSGLDKPRMLFFLLINVEMPTTVGILTFMSRKHFMLNSVEHEKSFITSGPGQVVTAPKFKSWVASSNLGEA